MPSIEETMAKPIVRDLVETEPLLRFAYSARSGEPRVIPLAYLWDGEAFRMWTIPFSAKVTALRAEPRVAITIDRLAPNRILLARGRAELDTVSGVPDGYLAASHRTMEREHWDGFDEQVRMLYDEMTEISLRPTWAKLIDFETTAPSAVEEAARRKGLGG